MRHLFFLVLFVVCIVGTFSSPIAATDKPLTCGYVMGEYSGQEIFARYEMHNQRLLLVSWNTADIVQELETSLNLDSFETVTWSPNCQHLVAVLGETIAAWDVSANIRMGTLDAPITSRHRYEWSPDNDYLIIQTDRGGFLWHLPSNRQTLINPQIDTYGRSFFSIEWDTARNQLLVVQSGSTNGVTAFDLSSSQQVGFFHIGERSAPVEYVRFENNQSILVYSSAREHSRGGKNRGLALWNRDTLEHIQLDPGSDCFNLGESNGGAIDLIGNLTDHYFIINDSGLYCGQLYIWDLQKLIGQSPYTPNFQMYLTIGGAEGFRFVNDNVIELVDWNYWGYTLTPAWFKAYRIDISTGSTLLESNNILYETCGTDSFKESEQRLLLEWGCSLAKNLREREYLSGVNEAIYWRQYRS